MARSKKEKKTKKRVENDFQLGSTIRHLRHAKNLSGVELCRKAKSLDPKTLTALEKGRIKNPSIQTLQAVSKGLGLAVSDLFRQAEIESKEHFYLGSQKGAYKIDFFSKGIQLVSFVPRTDDFFCGKLILESKKEFSEALFQHMGSVFMLVLVGQFEGTIEGKGLSLKEGENLFFRGGMKFSLLNPLNRNSALLLVTVPSCFGSSQR